MISVTAHIKDFDGRVALVSGAGRGIGAATAALLASRGAGVLLADIDEPAVSAAAEDLRKRGLRAEGFRANVTNAEDCQAAVNRVLERFGRLDILINNAAVGAFDRTIVSTTDAEWDRVLRTDLTSVFLLTQACVPALRSAGGGCVVNVSSVHALMTTSGVLPYAAAKGGVLSMTRALAIELAADRIRAVAILPGAIDTAMLRDQSERTGKSFEELGFSDDPRQLGRVGKPEEVAEVIAFAASPAASLITGSAIIADAGLLAAL